MSAALRAAVESTSPASAAAGVRGLDRAHEERARGEHRGDEVAQIVHDAGGELAQ